VATKNANSQLPNVIDVRSLRRRIEKFATLALTLAILAEANLLGCANPTLTCVKMLGSQYGDASWL
jgi:hypothetical protein